MGKQLTLEMIVQRTRTDRLDSIKNLNLWGNDLDNVSVISELPNLEVLSLSVNRISTLRDFADCPRLTELYLRKNSIPDLSEVQHLAGLKQLRVLWLCDNPCADTPNYRLIVIRFLPHLLKLDNTEVTGEERAAASGINLEDGIPMPAPPPPAARDPPATAPASAKRKHAPPKEPEESPRAEPAPAPVAVPTTEEVERPLPALMKGKSSARPAKSQQHAKERQPEPAVVRTERVEKKADAVSGTTKENILCAVLALLKELDKDGLSLVRRDIDRKLAE